MRYISFLRGINIGGNKIIRMEDVKEIYESLNLKNVKTILQSGNVLFDSPLKDTKKIEKMISEGLFKKTGFDVAVFTRRSDILKKIFNNNPFPGVIPDKNVKIYITFLNKAPSDEKKREFESLSYDAEKFICSGEEVYMLIYKDRLRAKPLYSTNLIEKKLELKGTSRDWNTITRIVNINEST